MSSTKPLWHELMKKEISRKQFLGYMGLAVLTLLNIEPLFRMFNDKASPLNSDDYGSDVYKGIGKPPPGI